MRSIILTTIGIFVLVTPGVLTFVIAWSIMVPKHRKIILNQIKIWKGDLMSMLERIQGTRKESDKNLVSRVDIAELDVNRINSVDKAFEYIERNAHEKAVAFTPAMMVGCFGIGAGLIIVLWILSTYLPVAGNLPF